MDRVSLYSGGSCMQIHNSAPIVYQCGGVGSGGVLFFRLLLKNTELRPHLSRIPNF